MWERFDLDQTGILLLYQELENRWDELEKLEYSPEIQALLEEVWEAQTTLLNLITIQ